MNPTRHSFSVVREDHQKEVIAFLKLAAKLNWEVTSMDDLGVHLRQKKRYGSGYLIVGAATAVLIIGFVIWIVGLLDFLRSSDRMLFVPYQDLTGESALRTADLLV